MTLLNLDNDTLFFSVYVMIQIQWPISTLTRFDISASFVLPVVVIKTFSQMYYKNVLYVLAGFFGF